MERDRKITIDVSESERDQFLKAQHDKGYASQREFVFNEAVYRTQSTDPITPRMLIEQLGLSAEDEARIQRVVEESGYGFFELVKMGVQGEFKRTEKNLVTMQTRSGPTPGVRGSATKKIDEAVKKLMRQNAEADAWYERTYITENAVFNECRSNRQTIKRYFVAHQAEIDAHNAEFGLDAGHNRRVAYHRSEPELYE